MRALFSSPLAGRIMAVVAVGLALAIGGAIAAQSGTTPRLPVLHGTSRPCQAAQLQVLADTSAARPAKDGTYVPVDLINQWHEECALRGYLPVTGVAATAGDDVQAVRMPGAIAPVILGQYYAAHVWVLIAHATGRQAAGCQELKATGLRVSLPHIADQLGITYPFTACAGPGQALLSVMPVLPGLANPAFFP